MSEPVGMAIRPSGDRTQLHVYLSAAERRRWAHALVSDDESGDGLEIDGTIEVSVLPEWRTDAASGAAMPHAVIPLTHVVFLDADE